MEFILLNAAWATMIATVGSIFLTIAVHGNPSRWDDLIKVELIALFVFILALVGLFTMFQAMMFQAGEQAAHL